MLCYAYGCPNPISLANSEDSVMYVDSILREAMEPSTTQSGECENYYEECSQLNDTDIDSDDVQYYVKQLAQRGPKTKTFVTPFGKRKWTTLAVSAESSEESEIEESEMRTEARPLKRKLKRGRPSRRPKTTTRNRSITTPYPGDLPSTFKFQYDSREYYTAPVRRKRWLPESSEDIEKYTTLDSLEKELLFSGKYAPWQRKLYAFRKILANNQMPVITTRKRIIGKKRLKKFRKNRGIHEPGYRIMRRLNMTFSYEVASNETSNVTESYQREDESRKETTTTPLSSTTEFMPWI